ncbi:hypothetical protein ACOMHN_025290 [Nucella lapillus]
MQLYTACAEGDVASVKRLVQSGISVNTKNADNKTPLHEACESENLDVVNALLDLGADINARCVQNTTPLFDACEGCNLPLVRLLLSRGADPWIAYYDGDTPLIVACAENQVAIVKELLLGNRGPCSGNNPRLQADVDQRDGLGNTALHVACVTGNLDVMKLLIQSNADVNARDNESQTPLFKACFVGRKEVVNYLLELNDPPRKVNIDLKDDDGCTPLHIACQKDYRYIVKRLLRVGASLCATDISGETPLFKACFYNNGEVVNYLLSKISRRQDADIGDMNGVTPVHVVCERGFLDLLVKLKDANLRAQDSKGQTPLFKACSHNREDIVEYLLGFTEGGLGPTEVDVNKQNQIGFTPLHIACKQGFVGIVNFLLHKRVGVNVRDEKGETALFKACKNNSSYIVRAMLQPHMDGDPCQTDVAAKNRHGRSALHIACQQGNLDCVKLLLDKNADLLAKDKKGMTPFSKACQFNHLEVVKFLLRHHLPVIANEPSLPLCRAVRANSLDVMKHLIFRGMRLDARGKKKETLLHIACQKGHYEMAELLVKRGLPVNAVDHIGQTALHYAVQRPNNLDMLKLLTQNGADVNIRCLRDRTALHSEEFKGDEPMRDFLGQL